MLSLADSGYNEDFDKRVPPENKNALNALYFGIASLFGWIIPVVGIPLSLIAIILGFISLKSRRKDLARSGISLGAIGILLSLTYMMVIYYLMTSNFFEIIERLF